MSACSDMPDLGRAEQRPFAPNQAVTGCAGYFEARCDCTEDGLNAWKLHSYAKAFFTDEENNESGAAWTNVAQKVTIDLDSLSYDHDTLRYRDATVSYRNWFWNGNLKSWDSIQIWKVEDKNLGNFSDSIVSPAPFTISYPTRLLANDSILRSTGFTISYTSPNCDSVWMEVMTGNFPHRGQPFEKYVNDMPIHDFFNQKVPATGTFHVTHSTLDTLPPNSMIGVQIDAQTAKLYKHSGKWFIYRATSVASVDRDIRD